MPLVKVVKFFFYLKHPKMATEDVDREVVSVLVPNSMFRFPKNRKLPFHSQNCPVIFQNCPLFSRRALLFPRSVFSVNVSVFQTCFFPQMIVLSICSAESWDDNCLALKTSTCCMISMYIIQAFVSITGIF